MDKVSSPMKNVMDPTPAVDVVYTWVNGNAPGYQDLYRRYGKTSSDLNPERYRDLYSMLKYSLRSVARYVPWVRDIYIFTCRPQVPSWLNLNHPRVHIVHHDQLIDSHHLPTFNCNVIESYLHAIPNPSDHVLYMNDDFLFGRETPLDDFIEKDGRIKVNGTLWGERSRSYIYEPQDHFTFRVCGRMWGERLRSRIYSLYDRLYCMNFIEHTPLLIYKPFWREMLTLEPEEVARTRTSRFRQQDNIRMGKLYRYYLLSKQRRNTTVVRASMLLKYHHFQMVTNNLVLQQRELDSLKRKNPKFYCLNDDQQDDPNPAVYALYRDFLADQYPDKSPYER